MRSIILALLIAIFAFACGGQNEPPPLDEPPPPPIDQSIEAVHPFHCPCETDDECGYGNICKSFNDIGPCCIADICCVWFNGRCTVYCY